MVAESYLPVMPPEGSQPSAARRCCRLVICSLEEEELMVLLYFVASGRMVGFGVAVEDWLSWLSKSWFTSPA